MNDYDAKCEDIRKRFDKMDDLTLREMTFGGKRICIIYISNFCSKDMISRQIITPLKQSCDASGNVDEIENKITSAAVKPVFSAKEAEDMLLAGSALIIEEAAERFALTAAVKNEEGRTGNEPETENVIRGPHEGFTESGEANAMLLRRRIKSTKLKKEVFKIGDRSRTAVALMYIEGIADENVLCEIRKRIADIRIDGVADSGIVETFIQDGKRPIYPTVGNSERPDKVAAKLLEGRAAIIVDGSPVVLTVPYLFCEGFQVAEDYSKSTWYASFIRLLRLVSFFIALYLPAIFVALELRHKELMSQAISDAVDKARENLPFSVFWEVLVIFLIFEIVREVGLRMPKAVGSAVGLVGSLILGDSAIEAGVASAPVLIVVALAAVCNFIVPPYMHPNILYRFIMIIISGAFGLFGFFLGVFIGFAVMASKTSFGVPYFYPFAPISVEGIKDFPIMTPIWDMVKVPRALAGKDIIRVRRKENEK